MYNTILPYVPQIYVVGVGMILSYIYVYIFFLIGDDFIIIYICVCVCISLLAVNYHDFFVLFAHTNLVVSLVYFLYKGGVPFAFNFIHLLCLCMFVRMYECMVKICYKSIVN